MNYEFKLPIHAPIIHVIIITAQAACHIQLAINISSASNDTSVFTMTVIQQTVQNDCKGKVLRFYTIVRKIL
jgi:hypothetical protein